MEETEKIKYVSPIEQMIRLDFEHMVVIKGVYQRCGIARS